MTQDELNALNRAIRANEEHRDRIVAADPLDYSAEFPATDAELLTALRDRLAAAPPVAAEPVAYGMPNSAITGSNRWMMLRERVPADDQYGGAMWVPLYTHPKEPVAAEPVAQISPAGEVRFDEHGQPYGALVNTVWWNSGDPLYTHPKEPVNRQLLEALRAVRRMRNCPIVDDDFPRLRDDADRKVAAAIAAAEAQPDMDIDDVAKAPPQKVEAVIKGVPAAQPALPTQQQPTRRDFLLALAGLERAVADAARNEGGWARVEKAREAVVAALPREKQP